MNQNNIIDLYHVDGEFKNDEWLNILFCSEIIRVEHVHMPKKESPINFWYDVPEDEWGLIISGYLELEYFDPSICTRSEDSYV